MKAIRFYGPNDLRVEEVDIPPLKPDEVRINVKAAGICGSDILLISGGVSAKDAGVSEKGIIGHEFSGVITEIGSNVKGFHIGDEVAIHPQLFCGNCYYCKKGQFIFCKEWRTYGYQYPGGFAEYVNVKASNVIHKPKNLSFEEVALLDPLSCGLHGVHRANINLTESIAIIGCGTIGLSVLTCAKAVKVRRIYAIDLINDRLKIAKEMGADECINSKYGDPVEKILELTNGEGVDVIFEAVGGSAETIQLAMKIVRKGGRIVYLGWFTEPKLISLVDNWKKEVSLIPSYVWGFWNGIDEFRIALDMLARREVDIRKIITHRFPLEEIMKALELINKKEENVIKVILNP